MGPSIDEHAQLWIALSALVAMVGVAVRYLSGRIADGLVDVSWKKAVDEHISRNSGLAITLQGVAHDLQVQTERMNRHRDAVEGLAKEVAVINALVPRMDESIKEWRMEVRVRLTDQDNKLDAILKRNARVRSTDLSP